MDGVLISEKERWNNYIQSHAAPDGDFLQSFEWGEFQKAYGRRVFRLGVMESNELVYGWQVIEMKLPLGFHYFYIPRPIRNYGLRITDYGLFIKDLCEIGKKEGAIFVRVDGGGDNLEEFGFRKVSASVQPEEELIMDITKLEEEILAQMKQKTRYNIKVAEKHGVGITDYELRITDYLQDKFCRLIQLTSTRQGIRPHPKEYYKKMIEILGQEGRGKIYFAEYQNKIIAGIFVVFFGKTATYLHGGSDDKYKNVMAPYLLHWRAMCDAKEKGFEKYNFGGVSSIKKSWEGITRFKAGFGSNTEYTRYGGVWELPVKRNIYTLYNGLKNLKNQISNLKDTN